MISFLFWNLNKKPLQDTIARLAKKYEIDVLMFVEFSFEPSSLLIALNKPPKSDYFYSPIVGCNKIELFTKFSPDFIRPIYETDRLTIRHLKLPGLTDVLIAITHFPSKMHWSNASQVSGCFDLADSVKSVEKKLGHSRTILVGDLNMNPFEDGVVGATGLHSVMARNIAQKGNRIVQGKEYPFFYNPMWNFFGDATQGPPGTYYYSNSEPNVFFWNIFDQLLLRPQVLNLFNNEDLMIIDSDGDNSFLSLHGNPNDNIYSDHLPILFKLNL